MNERIGELREKWPDSEFGNLSSKLFKHERRRGGEEEHLKRLKIAKNSYIIIILATRKIRKILLNASLSMVQHVNVVY